jgi:hypothetical protein
MVYNVLVDMDSAVHIIFMKALRQMQELKDRLQEDVNPLRGFGGKQVATLMKLSMSISFGYVNNTRTEAIRFDIVDMEYPYKVPNFSKFSSEGGRSTHEHVG